MLLGTASCDDDPELEPVPTPQPEPEPEPTPTPADTLEVKCLAVQPDWSEALADEDIPENYLLFIGNTSVTADAHSIYMYSDSVQTEPYSLIAYNEPEGITVADNLASIQTDGEGLMTPTPGYLFAADTAVTVASGDTALVPLRMHRLLTPITLTLNFSQATKVSEVEATLGGLVSAVYLPEGTPTDSDVLRSADGNTARMAWEVLPGNKGIKLYLRTFGTLSESKQLLNVSVTLSDNRELTFSSDLSDQLNDLAHFEPVALENTLDTSIPSKPDPEPERPPYRPDPDVPVESTGTISDWVVGTVEDDVIAN